MIRELQQKDFRRGFIQCLNALSETKFRSEREFKRIFALRKAAGIKTFVMTNDRFVNGTYSLILEPKFIHGGSFVGHIEDVAVHPDCQGNGIGRALMDHAINYCRLFNCYKLVLHCSPALVPYYEKAGFYHNGAGMRLDLNADEEKD